MKTLLAVLLLLPSVSFAKKCSSGTEVYKDTCVDAGATPYSGDPTKPSDEKPPEEKLPSYQRPGVVIVNAPNMADADAKLDQEKAQALAEGEKAAGITPEQKKKRAELNKEAGK